MEELKTQIEKLNDKWESEIEILKEKNKKLTKELTEIKEVLFTFEKVCKKIRSKN